MKLEFFWIFTNAEMAATEKINLFYGQKFDNEFFFNELTWKT